MITDRRLHEITGSFRSTPTPITGRNYADQPVIDPLQALQIGPVITCNDGPVIDPISSGAPEDPLFERGPLSISSLVIPVNSLFDEPQSENPAPLTDAEWAERGRRLEAARRRALDAQPRTCPNCGGDDLSPVFDPDGTLWTCACGNVFEEGR